MNRKNTSTALETVLEYFKAWNNKNFKEAANLLSDNIAFEMPINSYGNKNEFMQAVQFIASASTNIKIIAKFGDETEAVLLYDVTLAPIGNLRITEHFKVEKNKIVFIRHIHDTYELRKAGFNKGNS
jgi:limonene-1,2-epoxide hydrolase